MQQSTEINCLRTIFVSFMEQHQPKPPVYIEKVQQLNQAIFYCYNESSERMPVSRVSGFTFKDDGTLHFNTNYFPVTGDAWNIYAAELHFYRKGATGSLILYGVAAVDPEQSGFIQFCIKDATYFEYPSISDKSFLSSLFKPYIHFCRKGSELLLHTFKRKPAAGFDKISANA